MKKTLFLTLFFVFLLSQATLAMEAKNIEIFDPSTEQVAKSIPLSDEVQTMVLDWFSTVDEIDPRANIFQDNGYVIKFPLSSSEKIKNKFIEVDTDEVYLLIPESEDPFFMILTEKNQPMCFTFSGDIDKLSQILDFQLQ